MSHHALRVATLVVSLLGAVFAFGVTPSSADTSTAANLTAQADVQQRLALSPAVYVAESEYEFRSREIYALNYNGFAAFIDGATDALTGRTAAGSSLSMVAVSPDGKRVYITDEGKPVLHVFDAETRKEIRQVELPGVTATKGAACASGVACTPDGTTVLVGSNAGLLVVDTATDRVVRTLSNLRPVSSQGNFKLAVAVSFDGKSAYVTTTGSDGGFRLVRVDVQTWDVTKEITVGRTSAIAVKPDDSEVFLSEWATKGLPQIRVVDATTLEDLWSVNFTDLIVGDPKSADTTPGVPRGLALLPDGSKAYVVTFSQAVTAKVGPRCFCSVVDTAQRKVVKEIPLEVLASNNAGPQSIAVRSDGTKAYINGGPGQHAIVIDTINDAVSGVVGDKSPSQGAGAHVGQPVQAVTLQSVGVAVRPFWWSTESLAALGLVTSSSETDQTTTTVKATGGAAAGTDDSSGASRNSGQGGDNGSAAAQDQGTGSTGGDRANAEDGLSGSWLALIVVLAVLGAGLLGAVGFLLARARGHSGPVSGRQAPGSGHTPGSNQSPGSGQTSSAAQASTEVQTAGPQTAGAPPTYCSACGAVLDAGGRFCPACGRQL